MFFFGKEKIFGIKKQWVTSQPPIVPFNLNLNYEKFICLFTVAKMKLNFEFCKRLQKKILFLSRLFFQNFVN
jgi:hypothetical protein